MISELNIPTRPIRKFLPENLEINDWSDLESFFNDLENRTLDSIDKVEKWMLHRAELEAVLEEDFAWRYIRMNIDTTNEALAEKFNVFVTKVQPKMAPKDDVLNKKLYNSPLFKELDPKKYLIFIRSLKTSLELFREENVSLFTLLSQDQQKFGAIVGALTVEHEGEELTLQQAGKFLKENDRTVRESFFHKISEKRLSVTSELQKLLTDLLDLRFQVGTNAGYKGYLDYKFDAMQRFDYSISDCENFHEAIQKNVVPIVKEVQLEYKSKLGIDNLRPWDMDIDPEGREPLKPFEGEADLIEKSVKCLSQLDPYFGECLSIMNEMGHLDLESKKGKAPGGFNYPLYEIGVPFIYMNSVGTQRDVVVMLHEAGHAIHSFLSRDLKLTEFKSVTSEVAELASMSMELISMDHWDVYYDNEEDLKRAKKSQLEGVLATLPWIAIVDKFQHWLYTNVNHSEEERLQAWNRIMKEFGTGVVDYSGLEEAATYAWQKQLHIYEVPMYYIEYGMAQLGAIAMWRNFKQDKAKAIQNYKDALALGYTKPIGEIYEAAGIKFDFSADYVKELMDFVKSEMDQL